MLLGLDNAGKTTLLKSLASEDVNTITPTQVRGGGASKVEETKNKKCKITNTWDDLASHGHVVCSCSQSHFLFLFCLSFSSPWLK